MGYRHIDNLYKNQTILEFRNCFAMEKVHGTSAHIRLRRKLDLQGVELGEDGNPLALGDGRTPAVEIIYFAGGAAHPSFVALFDEADLKKRFIEANLLDITIYGEAYGGKMQGMSHTYGKELRFIAFEVEIADKFLGVESADYMVQKMGLEFVPYRKISTDLASLDAERDLPSRVAVRRGILEPKIAEGVVLRPPLEVLYPPHKDGPYGRIIVKHKRDEFKETATKRDVTDPAKLLVLTEAKAIAEEWVTPMRLEHVLDKLPAEERAMEAMGKIIYAMVADVLREGGGEFKLDSDEARKAFERAVGARTAVLMKAQLRAQIAVPE